MNSSTSFSTFCEGFHYCFVLLGPPLCSHENDVDCAWTLFEKRCNLTGHLTNTRRNQYRSVPSSEFVRMRNIARAIVGGSGHRPCTLDYINECKHERYVCTQTHSGYRSRLFMRRVAIHKSRPPHRR